MVQESEELGFLEAGVAAHNGGDLEQAEACYRKVLAINPYNSDALHLLGFLAFRFGFAQEAISLIEDAIQISPKQPLYFNNIATVYKASGEDDKALSAYRRSIKLKRDDPDVLNDFANLLRTTAAKRADVTALRQAKKLIRKAIKLNSGRAQYHNNLGNVLRDLGPENFDEARKSYECALQIDANLAGTIGNLGLLAQMQEDLDQAEKFFLRAVALAPDDAEAHNNHAQLLDKTHRLKEAIVCYDKALALDPENYAIRLNKARSLMHIRRDEEALAELQKLMEQDPSRVEAFWNFAITLRKMEKLREGERFIGAALEHFPDSISLKHELASIHLILCELPKAEEILQEILDGVEEGKMLFGGAGIYATLGVIYLHTRTPEEVVEMFRIAMEMEPDNMNANINYALSLISMGMLEEGWKRYINRWESVEFTSPVRPFQKPIWQGQPLQGKTIALWGEQGIGDEIRYASLIPEIMDKGADVVIECDPRLVDIFARSFAGANVFGRQEDLSVPFEDACDYQIPVLDLAGFFRPTIESFPPAPYAYLQADPGRMEFWRGRLDELGRHPKIGVLWRSILFSDETIPHYATVEELEPILKVQGIDFINLMYAECSEDRARIAQMYGVEIHTWDDINLKDDQDDLAALISSVDLVIGPMTATTVLAGALAVPVLCFLTKVRTTELLGNPDAPGWAPSMRHFVKGYQDPWSPVMEKLAAELKRLN